MADGSLPRCPWPGSDPLYVAYHDEEWGTPVTDDGKLFEFLLLEGAQAGLSWITILRRREGYRRAFDGFDPDKIARYDGRKIAALLGIRNYPEQKKIEGAGKNARPFSGSGRGNPCLPSFGGCGRGTLINRWKSIEEIPAVTPLLRRSARP